jgi:Zn/Cd-binding protein ZinT
MVKEPQSKNIYKNGYQAIKEKIHTMDTLIAIAKNVEKLKLKYIYYNVKSATHEYH